MPQESAAGARKDFMHLANAPFRERGARTAFMIQEPEGSGSRFCRKQLLDAHASFNLSGAASLAPLVVLLRQAVGRHKSPARSPYSEVPTVPKSVE